MTLTEVAAGQMSVVNQGVHICTYSLVSVNLYSKYFIRIDQSNRKTI